GRSPSCTAATTYCRTTSASSRLTCCGTASCCRMRRSPTTSPPTRSSRRCSMPWPSPRSSWAAADLMPMRTAPERLLARLEWRVVRRLDGRLSGGYRTAHRGTGTDLVGLREYTEGDDARHIDWNVTARLNEPQLRVFTEDRELTVWLVLDRSASMTVGGPERGKHDVLSELALVLARLFGRGGNRIGALLYDTGVVRIVPAGTGRRHALRIGAELARTAGGGRGSTTDLAAMLD